MSVCRLFGEMKYKTFMKITFGCFTYRNLYVYLHIFRFPRKISIQIKKTFSSWKSFNPIHWMLHWRFLKKFSISFATRITSKKNKKKTQTSDWKHFGCGLDIFFKFPNIVINKKSDFTFCSVVSWIFIWFLLLCVF